MASEQQGLRLGMRLACEWLVLNRFLWGGVVLATVVCFAIAPNHWERNEFWEAANLAYPTLTTIPYILYVYIRSLRVAWRIRTGRIPPPQIDSKTIDLAFGSKVSDESRE